MSTFKVSVEKIGKVYEHPNADKLSLAQVEGMTFQFCSQKGQYGVGDLVAYFPIDSVMPKYLIDAFGIGNFLSGKDKNRLKTVKLRGQISQGFVVKLSEIPKVKDLNDPNQVIVHYENFPVGSDLTELLGVTKYEPPEVPCHAGNLVKHPEGICSYDIEGCDRYPDVVAALMDCPVIISEKCEGSNHYSSILTDDTFVVGQRNYQIKPMEGLTHDWWKVALEDKHEEKLRQLKKELNATHVSFRSELCGPGIQDNIYQLKRHTLFTFDILVDGKYLSAVEYLSQCEKLKLQTPPIISLNISLRSWLAGRTIQEASSGKSALVNTLREGTVFKPMIEQECVGMPENRLILKQRDPIYLDKTGK